MKKQVATRFTHGVIMGGVLVGMGLMLTACNGEQPSPTASEWQDPQGQPVQPDGQEQAPAVPEPENKEVNWPEPSAQ